MINQTLFDDGTRRWVFIGRDPERQQTLIDTNTYLVIHNDAGILLDPGGLETFPAVVSAVSKEMRVERLRALFASHQDPDIISSLSLWLGLCPELEVYCSWVWGLFIPHFGGGKAITPIPDEGGVLPVGDSRELRLIPAHYLHSSGNFSVYDPAAKILFSGDIGAALLPEHHQEIFVKDFAQHVRYMEGFHRRWMPSNEAKAKWIARVRQLDVRLMCPQHGAIFRDEDVTRFLSWFEALEVGSAVRVQAAGGITEGEAQRAAS